MKDKNLAAVLAFFGGQFGLHRFYLQQIPLAFLYFIPGLGALLGVIDAIALLAMDPETFERRYNLDQYDIVPRERNNQRPANPDRRRRYEDRQRARSEREQRRRQRHRPVGPPRRKTPSDKTYRRQKPAAPTGPEPGYAERQAGLRYFRDFEYDRAIIAFERALEANPQDVASHFNLACSYSCEESADEAFYHLDRAVALGFDDFERIQTHDSLAFLRVQPRFRAFEDKGYRLAPDRSEEEVVLENPIKDEALVELPEINDDLLEQLQRLATLREKGLLTENEFSAQKKRLLG